ncbi:MAG: hypothetical protein ACYDAY_07410 [Candidatus Dormibacteria bacterium]
MTRVHWLLLAVALALVGLDMQVRQWPAWAGYTAIGIGGGVAVSVIGSYVHDLMAGSGRDT